VSPRQLAELAVAVARHAEELSAADGPDPAALHRVWKRSARCFRHWREQLLGTATPALYAELFAAELPLRVWCTAVAAGRSAPGAAGAAVAAKIFSDLLDVRCTALQALAADHGLTASEGAALDRFRRRCERWTDMLIGLVAGRSGVTDYAARPDRAVDFAGDPADPFGDSFWPLITAGLRLAFAPAETFRGASEPAEAAPVIGLAAAVVSTFPVCAFGPEGVLRPLLLARAGRVVKEGRPQPRQRLRLPPAPVAEPATLQPPPAETLPHLISFASFRKRRPME
jgi:hypothetical protein